MPSGLDYRRFLQDRVAPLVLPVPDPRASFVYAPGRQLRLENRAPAPGYYEVGVKGRRATIGRAVEDVPPGVLAGQPRVSGHAWGHRLVTDQGEALPLGLVPPENPPQRFSPVTAAEWEDGTTLFVSARFESGVEEQVRQAFEEEAPLPPAVPASLLCAYAYSLLERAGRELEVRWSPLEIQRRLPQVAAGGAAAARGLLAELRDRRNAEVARRQAAQRAVEEARLAEEARRVAAERAAQAAQERAARQAQEAARRESAFRDSSDKVTGALRSSGAVLLDSRRVGENLEVRWRFMGERFVSIVDPQDLRVIDSGICLQQHDRELNLWSLPSAIREAVDTGVLHITRR